MNSVITRFERGVPEMVISNVKKNDHSEHRAVTVDARLRGAVFLQGADTNLISQAHKIYSIVKSDRATVETRMLGLTVQQIAPAALPGIKSCERCFIATMTTDVLHHA